MSGAGALRWIAEMADEIAEASPRRLHRLLYDCFPIFAFAGDRERAASVVRLIYDPRLPPWTRDLTVFVPGPIDVFTWAADLGDLTRNEPWREEEWEALDRDASLDDRIAAWYAFATQQVTSDSNDDPIASNLGAVDGPELWRAVQHLVRADGDDEYDRSPKALAAIGRLLDGDAEQVETSCAMLGIDLAVVHRDEARTARWVKRYAERIIADEPELALCLAGIAEAASLGWFRGVIGLDDNQLETAVRALADAVEGSLAQAAAPLPAVQKRRVTCEYSQFAIRHYERGEDPKDEIPFQRDGESEQGMSLFPTHVGLATPTATEQCVVELMLSDRMPDDALVDAVQAVSFPLRVVGLLEVSSVFGGSVDPVEFPPGEYDVLACFYSAGPADAETSLRRFRVRITFCPKGTLDAPKCLRMLEGEPPSRIVFGRD